MAKSIKGTQTEKNILQAFAGESQARNRYTFFSSVAKKEGYVAISDIFAETANQEKEHAERFFKFLEGGCVEITAAFPAGVIGTTAENLKEAAGGEYEEWAELYPAFARTAREEGFDEIARTLDNICIAEREHEKRYLALLKHVEEGTMFTRDEAVTWRCRNCGFVCAGKTAPAKCPACAHAQAYFEILAENW